MGFNFPPRGWALCDGQILPINQNQSLYSLLGTNYGGDGRTSFALPDLRGRTPVHEGDGIQLGQKGGAENVALTVAQMPGHTHQARGNSANATANALSGNVIASHLNGFHDSDASNTPLLAGSTSSVGAGQAHSNMQPYQAVTFCIAIMGLFPSRN